MCGCNKKKNIPLTIGEIMKRLNEVAKENPEQFTLCRYNAPCGTHFVHSPTKVIKQFGLQNYGRYTCNNEFYVHNDDVKRLPSKFIPIVKAVANGVMKTNTLATKGAIELAKTNDIDLALISGSGSGGKVLIGDVKTAIAGVE